MAYEFERDEWGSAVAAMSEREREESCEHSYRNADGMCGTCPNQAYP